MGKKASGSNDEEMIRATGDLIVTLGKDPSILEDIYSLMPNLGKFQSVYDRHRNVFNEVLGGNHAKEQELQTVRDEVNSQVGMLHGLAVLVADTDPSIALRLGVAQPPITKRTLTYYHLTSPDNFKLVYKDHLLIARANAVKGAKSYEVWFCEGDPRVENSWRHLTTSTRVNRIVLTGLTPGVVYYFRIRAISAHGEGPWSNFINMMAI